MLLWHAVVLTIVSFCVGVLGGFVGLALGTMRLPALLLIGMPSPIAAGTNILISGMSALPGTLRHLREGRVDVRIVLAMGVPAVAGASSAASRARWCPSRSCYSQLECWSPGRESSS